MALYASILTGGTNNHTTTSEEANSLATDFVSNGVIGAITNTASVAPMTGAFAINAQGTPDMTVAVTAGAAYITATPSGQSSQVLRARLSANENVTIAANSSGSTKYDFLYIKIDPTTAANPNLAGDDVASLVVSRSTSNSTDNGTPPTYGYLLAVITVSNGASSITNGNIRDYRIKSEITSNSSAVSTGWVTNALPAVSTVTHNGNRSYDVAFASTVASTLSEGMRLEFTKTVAGNGYMGGAFNGSSHYFTRTSANLGASTLATVTNNFTIEAEVQPTSYAIGGIAGRAESTLNNGFFYQMLSTGQIEVSIYSGGSANYRRATTYQSVPLNKKTHVTLTYTSTATTFVIYFDGVSVPFAVTTGGTAPTTAGTGGDFSIGRPGAYAGNYFTGYISNVAVFDAVLSAATIKQHATYKLTGSETNCIGAWSLDNTANDQSSAGNNLTAQGGVGYTAQSPHGQLGNGVETTKAVGLVMSVSGSTAVVQVPEGCTIPTTGGVSAVAYSTQANPYGWVADKGRWTVGTYVGAQSLVTLTSSSTWYHLNQSLNVPIGKWMLGFQLAINYTHAGATYLGGLATLSNANNTESDKRFTYYCTPGSNVSTSSNSGQGNRVNDISLSSATTFYVNTKPTNNNSTATFDVSGQSLIFAIPSSL